MVKKQFRLFKKQLNLKIRMFLSVDQNVQTEDQNIQESASNEPFLSPGISVNPNPITSGSLPSEEVQLLAQPPQNVNISKLTMELTADVRKFLLFSLPIPSIIPSSTPPPKIKTTNKLPSMSDLFDSLNHFVTEGDLSNKQKVEASGAAPPAKPSRAEKLASRELRGFYKDP